MVYRSEFGYIKDKYYRKLATSIDKAAECGIKEIALEHKEFRWFKEYLKEPEHVKYFYYGKAKIVKI